MISLYKRRKPASPCYARLRFGISQQQLADLLGVSRSLVTMMEQGKRKLPREANAIYLGLCQKADELPLSYAIRIKRGRKPNDSVSNPLFVPTVSKYRRKKFDTKKSWAHQRRLMELKNNPMPSLEARLAEARKDPGCNAFVHKLEEDKNRLLHSYALLEFKKEVWELRRIVLSAKLEGINKTLELMKPLAESLPHGRMKTRIEVLNVRNSFRQLQLSEELMKWGVPALLKTELQMNCIKRQVNLTDEWIGALSNTVERSGDMQYCIASEIAA